MKNTARRLLAAFLTFVLAATSFSFYAFADDQDRSQVAQRLKSDNSSIVVR